MKKYISKITASVLSFSSSSFMAFLCLVIVFSGQYSLAKGQPINGSGKIVTLKPQLNGFDKVNFSGMNGKVFIESGKPYDIEIRIDDNLAALLEYEVQNGELIISIEGNKYNRLYLEDTNISIRVSMPEISVFEHEGNGKIEISGITGRYFRIFKDSNADAVISGISIDELDIVTTGNGNINAGKLLANRVKVKKSGNGDVIINTNTAFSAKSEGNGDIINKGAGLADISSSTSGNGKIIAAAYIESNEKQKTKPSGKIEKGDILRASGNWSGQLTYLDYTSQKTETIQCNLEVSTSPDEKIIKMKYIYPEEADYNSTGKLNITADGTMIEGQSVIDRQILPDGSLKLITEEKGYDDYKHSTIRRIIVLSNDIFVITKMVKFDDEKEFFKRNEYSWKRS